MDKYTFIGFVDGLLSILVISFIINLIASGQILIVTIFTMLLIPLIREYIKYRRKYWRGVCC